MVAHIVRALLGSLSLLLVSAPVRAWTDAEVTSAAAAIDATEPDHAQVALDIGVRVSAGWLSRFELFDLDADLAWLPNSAPEFLGADGRSYVAVPSIPTPGSVLFEFPDRQSAPHPGDYRLHFAYVTRRLRAHAAASESESVVSWSLPRWPERLAHVFIRVTAPTGTRAVPTPSDDEIAVREHSNAVELTFHRIELPRTQEFTIQLALPAAAPASRPLALQRISWPDARSLALGFALALAWLAKRRSTASVCRALGLRPRRLLPLARARWCQGASFVLCASAVPLFERQPVLAAISGVVGVALALDRTIEPDPDARAIRPAARLRRYHADALDLTTLLGCGVCSLAYAALAWQAAYAPAAVSCAAWLAAPLFFTATRSAHTRALRERVDFLGNATWIAQPGPYTPGVHIPTTPHVSDKASSHSTDVTCVISAAYTHALPRSEA